jgi:hypothetical protein
MGEKQARKKHGLENASIKCNGQNINTFLKNLKKLKIVKTLDQNNNVAS